MKIDLNLKIFNVEIYKIYSSKVNIKNMNLYIYLKINIKYLFKIYIFKFYIFETSR